MASCRPTLFPQSQSACQIPQIGRIRQPTAGFLPYDIRILLVFEIEFPVQANRPEQSSRGMPQFFRVMLHLPNKIEYIVRIRRRILHSH